MVAVYLLLVWVLVGYVFYRGYKEWKANRAVRPMEAEARILDKRDIAAGQGDEIEHQYFLTFEYKDRQKEFGVDPETFNSTRVGEEGILHLRGEDFESWQPKSELEAAEDVYRRMMRG